MCKDMGRLHLVLEFPRILLSWWKSRCVWGFATAISTSDCSELSMSRICVQEVKSCTVEALRTRERCRSQSRWCLLVRMSSCCAKVQCSLWRCKDVALVFCMPQCFHMAVSNLANMPPIMASATVSASWSGNGYGSDHFCDIVHGGKEIKVPFICLGKWVLVKSIVISGTLANPSVAS